MRMVADVLAWIFASMAVVGLGGAFLLNVYLQWTTGFDSGAPFSFFAGIRMIAFTFQHPTLLTLAVIGAVGVIGLAFVAPRSRYARKNRTA